MNRAFAAVDSSFAAIASSVCRDFGSLCCVRLSWWLRLFCSLLRFLFRLLRLFHDRAAFDLPFAAASHPFAEFSLLSAAVVPSLCCA
jgi:hypothetical protein